MGQLKRLAAEEELFSSEWGRIAPAKDERYKATDLDDNGDPLSAARGVVLGMLLGSSMWAAILWSLF
jgi:hypothetical protein